MKNTIEIKDLGSSLSFELFDDDPFTGYQQKLSSWVVEVQEEAIRQKLIDMGWTPPEESDEAK